MSITTQQRRKFGGDRGEAICPRINAPALGVCKKRANRFAEAVKLARKSAATGPARRYNADVTTIAQELIDQARSGEPEAYARLVRALQAREVPVAVLIELARSPDIPLRRAAVQGSHGRTEAPLLEAICTLSGDPAELVRHTLAEALAEAADWPLDRAVERLLRDDDEEVRLIAARSARRRPAVEATLIARLAQDEDWRVRRAVAEALAGAAPRSALPPLVAALGSDADRDVSEVAAASIEHHLGRLGGYPADLSRPKLPVLEEAHKRVTGFRGSYPRLIAWLAERVAHDVDVDQLRGFGTLLTAETEADRLPHAYGVESVCTAVQAVLNGAPPRAVVLLGEPGSGKTAVVHELTHRLRTDPTGPWHVLRVAPADLLAGTTWLGEWQTKVRNLVQTVRQPRRVVLYVPNLEELSEAGRSAQSDSNVATALAPYIERGEVAILGESTPDAFRMGLGAVGSLRRLFHAVEVREPDTQQTRRVLQAVRDEAVADVPEPVLDRLVELADFYLTGTAQPGRTVGLLRRVLGDTAGRSGPVRERDVLTTLSTSTGIPIDFLDDAVPLDRAHIRSFFEARVMGQPEAVDAVVDLVTLVKAGLTDPGKPFGVLFFIGPTGVGKTELARSLAELLFGDAARLLRLDMSEFATYDAHERLIGWGGKPGLLTAAVRERPFSVLLFDEIEKAHPNVFDLCLQVFDAGRLTDKQGRTADFRRSIIILTSNIGSAVNREAPVGFGRGGTPEKAPDRDATLRELGRCFRPEFLNRLDRIVLFQPLAEETAVKIAQREVARVLARSGLRRRRLDVDVDAAVLALLLREGYSVAYGARPLKRTVERLVLLPVARAIAAGNVPPGALLHLKARGGQVVVEVAASESDSLNLPAPVPVAAVSHTQRIGELVARMAELRAQAGPLAARKSELVARAAAANFWDDPETARGVQDEIYRLDGVFAALDSLERTLRLETEASGSARGFASGGAKPQAAPLAHARLDERLAALESRARHVGFLVHCRDGRELGDAYLSLTLVASRGVGLDAVAKLAGMYAGLARRRGLETQALDDRRGGAPPEDTLTLLVCGAGAYALLAGEAGLHQVSRGTPRGRQRPDRDVVRVEVMPAPSAGPVADEVRTEVRPLADVRGRLLAKPRFEVQLLHVPTMIAVRAWTDGPKVEAVDRLRPLLAARVEATKERAEPTAGDGLGPFVRRYILGPAPLVRDLRTRRSTGRLDRVLQGHIDMFLGS
jgi:ATP-dependent Clp protease ATP-binding subunit ClpC